MNLLTIVMSLATSSVIPERTVFLEANDVVVDVVCTFSARELILRTHKAGADRIFDPLRRFRSDATQDFRLKPTGGFGSDTSPEGALFFALLSGVINAARKPKPTDPPCFALLNRFSADDLSCPEGSTSMLQQVSDARTLSEWPRNEREIGKCWKERIELPD